jgi:hypothetical protein
MDLMQRGAPNAQTLAAAAPYGSSYAGATAEITYGAGSPYFLAVGK